MKITAVERVRLDLPQVAATTPARRDTWNRTSPRSLPINYYPEFQRIPNALYGSHVVAGADGRTPMPGMGGGQVWVRVTVEDGTWGLGACGFGDTAASTIDALYAPLLTGRDAFAIEHLNDLMWRACQRLGDAGTATIARSAVDLALWDLKGKLLGLPVYSLLGGPSRPHLDLYATGDDLDWAQELGFTAFKVTNPLHYREGTAGLNRLEAKIEASRRAVGDDADLMLNAVMSFNLDVAVQVCERLRPFRLRWLEEPLIPGDTDNHVALKRAAPWMPIATGEDHRGRGAFRPLIEQRCVDVLQPDLCWSGGLTEAVKIYTMGEAAGLQTILHGGANSAFGQHFSLAMPECLTAEFWLGSDPGVPLAEVSRMPGVAVPQDGRLVPSDAPGFGFDLRDEQVMPAT